MRKRPNQDCIDILRDQRNEARDRLSNAKKKINWLILNNAMLATALIAKPLIDWAIQ